MTPAEKDQSTWSIRKLTSSNLKFSLLILFTVIISYGQTLWMDVWRDEHAIFFKFNHLYERTGYLGNGILGEGTYRFSVAPYWVIYKLFGYSVIWPYYLLNLIFYFFAAWTVYYLFSKILNQTSGRVAGLLFAAGYIATEGFIDLAGSMIFNVSIILLCTCLLAYHNYFKTRNYKFYLLAFGTYIFAIFLTPVRTHYFIGVLVLFDLLWFPIKKIWLRFIPFATIFYLTFLQSADSRTISVVQYIKDILAGKVYNLYSFFGSLGYLFIPDKYINLLSTFPRLKLTELLISLAVLVGIYLFSRKNTWIRVRLMGSSILMLGWYLITRAILSAPQLNPGREAALSVYLGGLVIIVIANTFICCGRTTSKLLILLFGWLILNLFTYAAYDPISIISTVDRYIAHSFVPLVGLLALAFYQKNRLTWIVIIWGVLNLVNGVYYQHNILINRSFPARNFYASLRKDLPQIKKGDILYVDVADNARSHFNSAFTVGQMPDETAIAWRYGIDRYDFRLITEFPELIKAINQGNVQLYQIYTFHYTLEGLSNTTTRFREILSTQTKDYVASKPTKSLAPIELKIQLIATPADIAQLKFPLIQNSNLASNSVARDIKLRQEAKAYSEETVSLRRQMKITTSSDWHENSPLFINDGDIDTAWRADRFIWAEQRHAGFTLDLGKPLEVGRLIWINAYPSHSPVEYKILASQNNIDWMPVKTYQTNQRLDAGVMQIETFPQQVTRYIKMDITKTLSDDSPGISEVWVVPAKYSNLDLEATEEYLHDPMGYVSDEKSYIQTLNLMNYTGKVQFSWQDNSTNKLVSLPSLLIPVVYDGQPHEYSLIIPVRGTEITDFKITFTQIPGIVQISNIKYRYITVAELSGHN